MRVHSLWYKANNAEIQHCHRGSGETIRYGGLVKGEWESAEELPTNYGGYSLYNKVKVTITDYDGEEPYRLIQTHKKQFPYNSKGRFANQTASSD